MFAEAHYRGLVRELDEKGGAFAELCLDVFR